jgi:hypothetical protein
MRGQSDDRDVGPGISHQRFQADGLAESPQQGIGRARPTQL